MHPTVIERAIQEEPFGWVFFWDSELYLRTGNRRHRLIGNAPMVVDRLRNLYTTGTAEPMDYYLAPFRAGRFPPPIDPQIGRNGDDTPVAFEYGDLRIERSLGAGEGAEGVVQRVTSSFCLRVHGSALHEAQNWQPFSFALDVADWLQRIDRHGGPVTLAQFQSFSYPSTDEEPGLVWFRWHHGSLYVGSQHQAYEERRSVRDDHIVAAFQRFAGRLRRDLREQFQIDLCQLRGGVLCAKTVPEKVGA